MLPPSFKPGDGRESHEVDACLFSETLTTFPGHFITPRYLRPQANVRTTFKETEMLIDC
jgi:hypothetical protein